MDLNVKLHGLKYDYKKIQGCFCKIPKFQRFSGFIELFSLRKISRICPQHRRPGPPTPAHGSTEFIEIAGYTKEPCDVEFILTGEPQITKRLHKFCSRMTRRKCIL
jgi:hypothetical protein